MADDKKKGKGLLLMLSKKPSGSSKDDDEGTMGSEDESEPEVTLDDVAQDLIDAIKADDASGVADALRAAHDMCSAGYEPDAENEAEGE